ncbi:MAG: hypothetical protein V1742_05490 [Pseudomonadota bacterium]
MTICDSDQMVAGMNMEMIFRVKQNDKQRNFRNYFWKATPNQSYHKE